MNANVNQHLINRNLFYMFKIISKDMKKGNMYNILNRHIKINIDCEGYHKLPIMKYKIMEEKIISYTNRKDRNNKSRCSIFVNKCYNEDANELDYKDKFIGLNKKSRRKRISKCHRTRKNKYCKKYANEKLLI